MIWIYCITFGLFSLFCSLGFFIRKRWNTLYVNKPGHKQYFNNENISVLIPFRNEAKNLPLLIDSIRKLYLFPTEILFINDHSEDQYALIFESLELPCAWKLLQLNDDEEGKKAALYKGISASSSEYILTWDADITVPSDYFRALCKIPLSDMVVMPVSMPGQNVQELFFEMDYQYLNAINTCISGYSYPISASGANLLFSKNVFLQTGSGKEYAHISSGDDLFLLKDFRKAGKTVELAYAFPLIVSTSPPATIEEFLQQRVRWAGKTGKVNDKTATLLGITGMIYHNTYWLLLFSGISLRQFVFLTLFKITLDAMVIIPYYRLLGRTRAILFIPLFSLIYPFYMLLLIVLSLFYEPTWKGREVHS